MAPWRALALTWLGFASVGLTACSGGGTAGRGAATRPRGASSREAVVLEARQRYPEPEFIVGIGESDTSAAMAESRAVADAAASIRSHVEANIRSVESGEFRDGRGKVALRVVEDIQQKVETDAGALIRPRRELTTWVGGSWVAVAAASRTELDESYLLEARPVVERLGRAYDAVLAAPSWLAAAAAWCEAQPLERDLERMSVERWAVSRKSLWSADLLSRSGSTHARERKARSSMRVAIRRLSALPEADPAPSIVADLRAAGWSAAVAPDAACPSSDLAVTPSVADDCRQNSFGIYECEATLEIRGEACHDGAALFAVEARARATDSRDSGRAKRAARRRVDASAAARDAVARTLAALGECAR